MANAKRNFTAAKVAKKSGKRSEIKRGSGRREIRIGSVESKMASMSAIEKVNTS